MKILTFKIEDQVRQLLEILKQDIEKSAKTLQWLDQLRALVIKRDDSSLTSLLTEIQTKAIGYQNSDAQRQCLRRNIADSLGWDCKQVTLTRLEGQLSGQIKDEVTTIKEKLQTVCFELKKEHAATAMLLNECARFNRLMLKNILDLCRTDTVTYNTSGRASSDGSSAFMNLKL